MLRVEHKEFETITKRTCNASCHNNVLSEPSHCFNNPTSSSNANTAALLKQPCQKACPKLTDGECHLLYDNNGCLKCHHFFVSHRSANCPNDFPNAVTYKTLTQTDVDRAKCIPNPPVAAVMAPFDDMEDPDTHNTHPVAAVLSSSVNPITYIASNASSIIGNGSEVCPSATHPPMIPSIPPSLTPFHVPHLIPFWSLLNPLLMTVLMQFWFVIPSLMNLPSVVVVFPRLKL
jgi:hypothetical protein